MTGDASDDRDAMYRAALHDFVDRGDLTALAAFIRAGHPIRGDLAQAIASALADDGEGDWRLSIKRRGKNRRTVEREWEDHAKKITVGAWCHVWIKGHDRSLAKQIRKDMADHFEVGETFVREALAYFRRHLALITGESENYDIPGAPRDFVDFTLAKIAMDQAEAALDEATQGLSGDKD